MAEGRKQKSSDGHISEFCYVILGIALPALFFVAAYWFDYSRNATYELRWTTGEQAGFNSYGPNLDTKGNPKVLVLLPGDQPRCYLISYSKDLLAYLRKENKTTIPVTLQLHYSFGKICSFTVLRCGIYDLCPPLEQLVQDGGSGDCVEQLDKHALTMSTRVW